MAMFKLPRLKSNLPIVDGKGNPRDFFLRFWNIEVAPRIEQQEAGQDEILAQIQAVQEEQAEQLSLVIAAQARADAAYNLAESAQGSRYIDITGLYSTVSGIINNQTAGANLSFAGTVFGGTIDANTSCAVTLTFYENNGGGNVLLGSVPITLNSNGLNAGGTYQIDPDSFAFDSMGSLAGNVTYTIMGERTSGANVVDTPSIDVRLTTVPKAT